MQHQKVIEEMGYSRKEAKVYMTLLRLGEAQISDIALKAGMPRTTVQVIVDRLHHDRLMNFYVMRGHKFWVAENPNCFLEKLKKQELMIAKALPALSELRKISRHKMHNGKRHEVVDQMYSFLSTSVQPILISDNTGIILAVNKAWEELFGYKQHEVKGKSSSILTSGQTSEALYEALWRTLRRRQLYQTDKFIDCRKDGTLFNSKTTFFCLEINTEFFYVQVLQEM